MSPRSQALAVAAVVLSLSLPFLSKPVHVDDVYFLEVAEGIRAHPARPFAGAAGLEDIDYRVFAAEGRCPETFASMSHPPLVPYVLAASATLAGGFREIWQHAALLPFPLLAALACLALARRFTPRPVAATLFLVTTPAFVVSSHSLMTDVPALALSLGGLALFVNGVDRGRRRDLALAGLLVGLALVTRYSAAVIVAVLLGYAAPRRRLRLAVPTLVGAGLVCGAWCWQNLAVHGELHVWASSRHYAAFYAGRAFDLGALARKAVAAVTGLGGTVFVAGLLALLLRRRLVAVFGAGLVATATLFVIPPSGFERLETYGIAGVLSVGAWLALGLVLLAAALGPPAEGRADPDQWFLRVWLGLALLGALLFLPFGAVRYLLPALPPLGFLLVRQLRALGLPGARERRLVLLAVGQGLALSVALALADLDLAERYRALAQTVRPHAPGGRIWYVGEWGFRYYMDRAGARYLRSDDERPTAGDAILRPEIAGLHDMAPSVRARSWRVQKLELAGRWPLRLLSFDAKAGFYSQHWGYLPWALSRAPLERVEIFEILRPGTPRDEAKCASS